MIYTTLREANRTRQTEWDAGGHANDSYWRMNELAGEAGEVCNVLKKLHRERVGVPGSRDTLDHLAEELADVVICLDLFMMTEGLPLPDVRAYHAPNENLVNRPLTQLGTVLTTHIGYLANLVELPSFAKDRDSRMGGVADRIMIVSMAIAAREAIDLQQAVMVKFNATSTKMKLETMMGTPKDATPTEPIPSATFYDATENIFRDFNGKDLGVDFWGKWRGRNHEFPTHPPFRD